MGRAPAQAARPLSIDPMYLAPHLHAVAVGQDVVVLDLAADAYFCLPGARRAVGLSRDRRSLNPSAQAEAELRGAGMIVDVATSSRDLPGPVRHDLLSAQASALRWRDVAALLGCTWDLFRLYRGRSLPAILAATSAPLRDTDQIDAHLIDLVGRFRLGVIWIPAPAKCLARSFLLLRFLQRHGRNARWVFGVRTWPFGAHCWLQVGDVALDEAADLAAEHTPIYAL